MTRTLDQQAGGFVRNVWYPAMWAQELGHTEVMGRRLLDEPLVFFRDARGQVRALSDACPHRQAPLHMGRRTAEGHLQCLYHGLSFDGQGQCVHNPHGDGRIPSSMRAKAYPVCERDTIVWIWMGEQPADESRVPRFDLMNDGDGRKRARASIDIGANYLLLADNLLDLSHANFLHEGILGLAEHCNAEIETEQQGMTVRCKRWMPNVPVARLHDLMFMRDGQPVDMWNEVTWHPPGCLTLRHGFSRPGLSREQPFEFTAVHLLTPETATSTRYSYGMVRPAAENDAEVDKAVAETRRYVFEEQDRVILEAQQRMLQEPALEGMRPVMFAVDAASVRMRRVMSQLLAAERGAQAAG